MNSSPTWPPQASLPLITRGAGQDGGRTERKSAWARLLVKVYEVDMWACPDCGGRMSVIAVIRDPAAHILGKEAEGFACVFAYASPIVGAVMFFLSYCIWKLGLRCCNSAGT